MIVKRIVPNLEFPEPQKAKEFYQELLDLDIAMDFGWVVTFVSNVTTKPELNIASQGGAGTSVPSISIEVENVDQVYERAINIGAEKIYQITDEDWGVRRFFVRDPGGNVLNILSHL